MQLTVSRPAALVTALLGTAALLLTAACSSTVTGTAGAQPYRPLAAASARATDVSLPKGAIAVSPDLSSVILRQGDKAACVVPTADPNADAVCADLPDNVPLANASFAPDSRHYIVVERYAQTFHAGAWIVETDTGSTRSVDLSATVQGSGTGATAADPGTTPGTTTKSSATQPSSPDSDLEFLRWRSATEVIGVSATGVVRVDAGTARASVIATVSTGKQGDWIEAAAIGPTRVALIVGQSLVVVDPADGTVGDPIPLGIDKGVRAQVLGVSPDGGRVLVSRTDLVTLRPGPTMLIDVAGRQSTVLASDDLTMVVAGAFSPDGSQVLLMASAPANSGSDDRFEWRLLPVGGGTSRRIGPVRSSAFGPLTWSPTNVLSGGPPFGSVQVWKLSD